MKRWQIIEYNDLPEEIKDSLSIIEYEELYKFIKLNFGYNETHENIGVKLKYSKYHPAIFNNKKKTHRYIPFIEFEDTNNKRIFIS